MNQCAVCARAHAGLHLHHVIQQADGGTDGPTVWLCGDCHTVVHAVARRMERGDSGVRYMAHLTDVQRDVVRTLAGAILAGRRGGTRPDQCLLAVEVTRDQMAALDHFAAERGFTARGAAVRGLLQALVDHRQTTPENTHARRRLVDLRGGGSATRKTLD